MCISPSGIPNTRLKAGISLNGAEFFPSGHQGQDFYFYREPQVTAVMPPKGDIRGGTRVVFYLAEDYLGNALAAMHSPEHFNDAVAAVRCKFDDVIVPSEVMPVGRGRFLLRRGGPFRAGL